MADPCSVCLPGSIYTTYTDSTSDELPEDQRGWVLRKLEGAWHDPDPEAAERSLAALARSPDNAHPGAASSIREGWPRR